MSKVLGADYGATVLNQDIYELSSTQKHRLGTRLVRGNRTFMYAKAGATLNTDLLAWNNRIQDIAYRTVAANAAAGDTELKITTTTGDGQSEDGAIAAHELEGGNIIIFPGSENSINMGIVDNTVVTASSHEITIKLDGALPIAITTSMSAECVSSAYKDVRASTTGNAHRSFVGLPMRVATTTNPYVWLQTWGPCWIAPANGFGEHNAGGTAHSHQLVARYGGNVQVSKDEDTNSEWQQNVGFVMFRGPSNAQGAPFMMLQISP